MPATISFIEATNLLISKGIIANDLDLSKDQGGTMMFFDGKEQRRVAFSDEKGLFSLASIDAITVL